MAAKIIVLLGSLSSIAVAVTGSNITAPAPAPAENSESCEMPNGYMRTDCGVGPNKKCCSWRDECITVKPKEGDDISHCSPERKLVGKKAVRVVLVPVLGSATVIVVVLGMGRFLNRGALTKVCAAQIILASPLFFSPMWEVGFYSIFLAGLLAVVSDVNNLVWWLYRLVWALQILHLVALFGPLESFHAPFLSLAGVPKSELVDTLQLQGGGELACSRYYEDYFKILDIEKHAELANPDAKVFGYCDMSWLGVVQSSLLLEALLLVVSAALSINTLLRDSPGPVPVAPKGQAFGPEDEENEKES